jgi:hypothetical protein
MLMIPSADGRMPAMAGNLYKALSTLQQALE